MSSESDAAIAESITQVFSNKRVNVLLDNSNYLLWKQHVVLTVRGLGLDSYLDESSPISEKLIAGDDGARVPNPAYFRFVQQDSSLASWLLSTVSPSVLPRLVGAETSASIWSAISRIYSKLSTTKIMHLHCRLCSLKKGAQPMHEFVMQVKEVCDLLAACGNPVSELEHIATIINGLPMEFEPSVAAITASKEPFSLDSVVSILSDAESRLMDPSRYPIGINVTKFSPSSVTDESDGSQQFSKGQNSRRATMVAPSQFQSADLPVLAPSATMPVTESNAADPVTEVEVTDVQVPDVLVQHEQQPSCVAMPAADASQSVASGDQLNMGDQDEVSVTIPAAHSPQSAASINEPNLNDQDEVSGSSTDSVNSESLVDHIVDEQVPGVIQPAHTASCYALSVVIRRLRQYGVCCPSTPFYHTCNWLQEIHSSSQPETIQQLLGPFFDPKMHQEAYSMHCSLIWSASVNHHYKRL
ncbi:hypothetical protein GQ457_03G036690 [Hibiscus cannabinus]